MNNKEKFVKACPEFLYVFAPEPGKERYAFKDRVALSLDQAYSYALKVLDDSLIEEVKDMFREEYGYSVAKEVRDISWVYGPDTKSRHYRITLEAIDGVESVSDYKVEFDEDWKVTSADEYNRVI